MKKEVTSWSKRAVFVCTKCSKEIAPSELSNTENVAENLKNYLKAELRSKSLSKEIRVMTSSCLGACPKGEQAIAVIDSDNSTTQTVIICHPEKDKTEILDFISR
ncbi:MAG: (2Fe-2S) ferredoxin domain-containing protein [Bdellovibrionaceae bacterium]|nr:(2Fe-2S) ferredoxin domain-containing protein [Pseudobdellovibrionaceae bacterium]